jgi:hypothetical protein
MRRKVAGKVPRGQTGMSPDRGSHVLDDAFCEGHGSEAGVILYGGTIGKINAMYMTGSRESIIWLDEAIETGLVRLTGWRSAMYGLCCTLLLAISWLPLRLFAVGSDVMYQVLSTSYWVLKVWRGRVVVVGFRTRPLARFRLQSAKVKQTPFALSLERFALLQTPQRCQ